MKITRRPFSILLACVFLLLAFTAVAERPNVLFILADDLGYGDLGCYSNPLVNTPILDALAAGGMRFTDAYAPAPLCAPSRAAILTGRYNHRTGAVDVSSNRGVDRIALDEKTFGDYFRQAGYATALIGKWHNGLYCADYLPHHRGFDKFVGYANGAQDYWAWHLLRNDAVETHDGRYLTDVLNDEAVTFVRKCARDSKPFALFLAHAAPHAPLQAPQPLIEKYKARLKGQADEPVSVIYAMIEQMDSGLGRVFKALHETGQWERTLIVFTSDNGAWLGGPKGRSAKRFEGALRGNKGETFEQGLRVPAIASWPGQIPGGRVSALPVHGCDWLPTLYGTTGATPPAGAKPLDGIDLLPLLKGHDQPTLAKRQLFFQKNRYTPVAHSSAAVREGHWKLHWPGVPETMKKDMARDNPSYRQGITQPPWEMPLDPELPAYREVRTSAPCLYDLARDPGESVNLAAQHPEIVARLTTAYDAWFREVFAEWKQAWSAIRAHDVAYWRNRPQ